MNAPAVSVIIVSRDRPRHLSLCLTAVSQLYYPKFEIVVVADHAGLQATQASPVGMQAKTIAFDRANISQARNLGIAVASGQLVAFLDDDSMPEPGWLFHLTGAFDDPTVDAATGYVRARNGIAFQVRGQTIDRSATVREIHIDGDSRQVFDPPSEGAISTIGTNCAFRRSVFAEIGGFDPQFDYFLDESDLNMRLALAGKRTAIVPLAQVHHQRAASPRRAPSGAPQTLFHIGRSTAIFLKKYAPDPGLGIGLALERQRRALLARMVAGSLEPRDVQRLLSTMRDGIHDAQDTPPSSVPVIGSAKGALQTFRSGTKPASHVIVSGFRVHANRLRQRAAAQVRRGSRVSLYLFSRTGEKHRIRFHRDGYWEHCGGLFAATARHNQPCPRFSLRKRTEFEAQSVSMLRQPIAMDESMDDGTIISR